MKRSRATSLRSRILTLALCIFSFFLESVFAYGQPIQRIEIPSSFNPVGSGARALGMGGAFIAVADDATAASWNPGGLIQLERPEISVVGAFVHRIEDNTFGTQPEASGVQAISELDLNYLSIAYPFKLLNRNMIVSLNYQNLYDLTRDWDFPLFSRSSRLVLDQRIDYEQEGGLSAFGLAYCVQIIPQLSFGFTLNYWPPAANGWKQDVRTMAQGTFVGNPIVVDALQKDEFTFEGFNANVGVLWHMTPRLTVGAVFKSPFTADLKHEQTFKASIRFPTLPGVSASSSDDFEEDEKLDMPMSYGVGLAYRFSDELTVSADVFRTEWPDFVLIDANGNKTSPISHLPMDRSDITATHQVRVGAEYLFVTRKLVIPVRAGVFYDPAPAEGSPDDFFGFSVGTGIAYGRRIFDVAYQYRLGRDVGESILQNLGFSQDVDEHTVYSSLIVHF